MTARVRTHVHVRRSPVALPSSARVSRIVNATLRAERKRVSGEINVIFVDQKDIRRLNRSFLDERGDTDVIAFPYDSPIPDAETPFGDVYVAVPVALRNARRFGEDPPREIARLIIHGVLHLLGHDDHRPAPRKRMWKRQEALVDRLHPARRPR